MWADDGGFLLNSSRDKSMRELIFFHLKRSFISFWNATQKERRKDLNSTEVGFFQRCCPTP